MVRRLSSVRPRWALALAAVGLAVSGCGATGFAQGPPGTVTVVGAESVYADVAAQIGGRYVHVLSVIDNPNVDPHSFEASPAVAREVATASVIVQNGLGYDGFMDRMEAATSGASRRVVVAARLLRRPGHTPNPHLWYDPSTMPVVARALAAALSAAQPAHVGYFRSRLVGFVASLQPWLSALQAFRAGHHGANVASTEPVADYLLAAMGTQNRTPFSFEAAVMNGTDPSPEDVARVEDLVSARRVSVLCYNQQVVDTITAALLARARRARLPVVGVYETMPSGYHYQSWMQAELRAVAQAIVLHRSTVRL